MNLQKETIDNISFFSGDILKSQMQTLVNTINCKGIMGAGLARDFKKLFPLMYEDYREKSKNKEIKVSKPYIWKNLEITNKTVLNFPTKNHWKEPSKMTWIDEGLQYFIENYKQWGVTSIAFPALGCNLGGLTWIEVKPLMIKHISKLDIPVEIYEPDLTSMEKALEKISTEINSKYRQVVEKIYLKREIFSKQDEWTNWKTTKTIGVIMILAEQRHIKEIKEIVRKAENIHKIEINLSLIEKTKDGLKEIKEFKQKQMKLDDKKEFK